VVVVMSIIDNVKVCKVAVAEVMEANFFMGKNGQRTMQEKFIGRKREALWKNMARAVLWLDM